MMTSELKQRIEKEANDYKKKLRSDSYRDSEELVYADEDHAAGATAWAERAEKLREALHHIRREVILPAHLEEIMNNALEQYKKETT